MDKKKISEMIDAYLDKNIDALTDDLYRALEKSKKPTTMQKALDWLTSWLPLGKDKESRIADTKEILLKDPLQDYVRETLLLSERYYGLSELGIVKLLQCYQQLFYICVIIAQNKGDQSSLFTIVSNVESKSIDDFEAFKKSTIAERYREIDNFLTQLEEYYPVEMAVSATIKYTLQLEALKEYGLAGNSDSYQAKANLSLFNLDEEEKESGKRALCLWDFYNFRKESAKGDVSEINKRLIEFFIASFDTWLICQGEMSSLSDHIEARHGADDNPKFFPDLKKYRDIGEKQERSIARLCSKVGIDQDATLQKLQEIFLKRQL